MKAFVILAFVTLLKYGQCGSCIRASAVWDDKQKVIHMQDGNFGNAIAWGDFKNEINYTGWSYLEIYTNDTHDDEIQAYAAGAVEAYLTKDLMRMHYNNLFKSYCDNHHRYCGELSKYIKRNLKDMNKHIRFLKDTNSYWYQVGLMMKQLKGLNDVFENEKVLNSSTEYTDFTRALYLQLDGDLIDLESMFDREKADFSDIDPCSVLIKVMGNNRDIYFAHDTWYNYKSMLRVLKKYVFPFKVGKGSAKVVPGDTVTMSSYPGKLVSLDDFYLLSSGLAVTETTNDNYNSNLFQIMTPEGSVLSWIRCAVANRLATTGPEWVQIIQEYNSGTYNNQWMILDYNLFTPGEKLKNNTFWIVEQMPEVCTSADMSQHLQNHGFWSSFNVPYFKDIFRMSGSEALVTVLGREFTHDECSRARIFRRDQGKVHDVKSMIALMRYNNYKHDPLSAINGTPPYNPAHAISSRYDLVDPDGVYPEPAPSRGAFGATDMKLTNHLLFKKLEFVAISGPTFDQVPVFKWSDSGLTDPHEGHPDVWNFGPITHKWGSC